MLYIGMIGSSKTSSITVPGTESLRTIVATGVFALIGAALGAAAYYQQWLG